MVRAGQARGSGCKDGHALTAAYPPTAAPVESSSWSTSRQASSNSSFQPKVPRAFRFAPRIAVAPIMRPMRDIFDGYHSNELPTAIAANLALSPCLRRAPLVANPCIEHCRLNPQLPMQSLRRSIFERPVNAHQDRSRAFLSRRFPSSLRPGSRCTTRNQPSSRSPKRSIITFPNMRLGCPSM